MISRINWDEYALWLAWSASQRSEARTITDSGEESARKVGACVLALDSNRVLALGYNGFLPGFQPPPKFFEDRIKRVTHILHAETNALVHVKRGEARLIATTLSPCAACAQQIVARGIPRVVYGEMYKDTAGIEILQFYGVQVIYLPLTTLITDRVLPAIATFTEENE
jgi:dCMP deaminase